jgi:hypothetical protein
VSKTNESITIVVNELLKNKTMNFLQMQNLTAGVFSDAIDFNITSICMTRGFDRDIKSKCVNLPSIWPNLAGALQYFVVR